MVYRKLVELWGAACHRHSQNRINSINRILLLQLFVVCGGECRRDGAGAELAHGARLEACAPARLPGPPSAALTTAHAWSRTTGTTDAIGPAPLTK
jgi:hypothetical protein